MYVVVHKTTSKNLSATALHVGGATMQPTSGARNLGVLFDSHLDLKQHISHVCRSCYFQLRQLPVVRRSLPPGVLRTLMHSFMSCCLDYCNSLIAGLPLCDLQRLQSVQNAAARLFGGVSKRGSVVPVHRDDLHWLPIKQRIDFRIGVLSFKAINGLAPQYLVEMFTPIAANPALRRNRSADRGDLIIQTVKNMSYGRRSFAISGTSFWNSLPVDLRRSSSLTEFKSKLNTHLFGGAY